MLSHETYLQVISSRASGPTAAVLRGMLRGCSWGYGLVSSLRNRFFDLGWKPTQSVQVPVVSVGNLTTGGTGKTPVVSTIVRMLQQNGWRPGIVSRGYRADETGSNDEKRVLERLCPGVPHIQNPDRILAGRQIVEEFGVDVIVLDDGFQHRRIHRDLDLVLVDATNPFGHGYLLPRGLLRESISGLQRADYVLITRTDQVTGSEVQQIEQTISRAAPHLKDRMARVVFEPDCLLDLQGQNVPADRITKCRVLVMTAIGNPQGFVDTCTSLGFQVAGTRFFPDHHHYTPEDVRQGLCEASHANAEVVLTTVKDLVKIQSPAMMAGLPEQPRVLAVDISTCFEQDHLKQRFQEELNRIVTTAAQQRPPDA